MRGSEGHTVIAADVGGQAALSKKALKHSESVHFLDADGLPGKNLAEVDLLVAQADAPAAGNHDGFIGEGRVDVRQSSVGTQRRLIDLSGTFHLQCFVRTLVVKDVEEAIKAGLLLQKVGSGRLGGFFLESEMHAFVTTVLLGMAGLDAFNANSQAEPPDRKLAQIKQGVRGSEGHTVIAADVGGEAALLKKPLKHSKSVVFTGRRKSLTG